jgi:hypothetical protein
MRLTGTYPTIQFYNSTMSHGISNDGSTLRFLYTTSDNELGTMNESATVSSAGKWTFTGPGGLDRMRASKGMEIPSGFGYYFDGGTSKNFSEDSGTYGTFQVNGDNGGFAGIRFTTSYDSRKLMVSTSSPGQWGVYSENSGLWDFYYNPSLAFLYLGSDLKIVPKCAWVTGGSSGSAIFSTGTGAASGGADGDVYFRTGASRGLYIRVAGTWELVAS